MPLSYDDERLIAFFFRADAIFQRSTFGAQLERAANQRASFPLSWAWLPQREETKERPEPPMHVHAPRRDETGYEVAHRDAMNYGKASRRMAAIARTDPTSYAVLASIYGDRGARWGALSVGLLDEETGRPSGDGVGPGSIAALYPLTEAGRGLIRREREDAVAKRAGRTVQGSARAKVSAKQRRAEREALVEEKMAEVQALAGAHRAASTTVLDVKRRVEEGSRGNGARLPEGMANELRTAARASRLVAARLAAARRALALLTRSLGHQNPIADTGLSTALEGPRLDDGRFYSNPDLEEPGTMARLPGLARVREVFQSRQTDDDVLEVALLAQARNPQRSRQQRLAAARDQADALLVRAWAAWLATDPERQARKRGVARREAYL